MINLDTTTKSLEVKIGTTVTTNQLVYQADYIDTNLSGVPVSNANGLTNNATAVTMVSAPASTKRRIVKSFSIYNKDTVDQAVTVQINDNGTLRPLVVTTVPTGATLMYTEGEQWKMMKSNGEIASGSAAASGISALTGDVTASGTGSVAATIASRAVTYAKFQAIATAILLGRTTASSGDIEDIAASSGLVLSAGTLSSRAPTIGSFTRDLTTASGTTTVTGLAAAPRGVLFWCGIVGSVTVGASVGADFNGTRVAYCDNAFEAGSTIQTSVSIEVFTASAGQSALITSFTSDGFVLTWTKSSTPTGTATIRYVVFY